jgi:hypothetical protein
MGFLAGFELTSSQSAWKLGFRLESPPACRSGRLVQMPWLLVKSFSLKQIPGLLRLRAS